MSDKIYQDDGYRTHRLEHEQIHHTGDPRSGMLGRIGKRFAGRMLDGRTHDEFPL